MNLRSFQEGDRAAVIVLWQHCDLLRSWNDPHKDIDRKLADLANGGSSWFWVVEARGKIIASAMAGYDGHRGSVNYLAVDTRYRGQGIGRLLMETIEAELIANGCPKLNLLIREDNLEVRAFYQAIGYGKDAVLLFSKRLIADD